MHLQVEIQVEIFSRMIHLFMTGYPQIQIVGNAALTPLYNDIHRNQGT